MSTAVTLPVTAAAVDMLEQKKAAPAGRILSSGKTVYSMDKIASDGKGRLQVMLLDQTVFTLGPNTEMTLDEFVYDPFTDTGKITANVTKGVFRFVTGKVARKDPENMKIKLPVGTIGIRGTIGGGYTDGNLGVAAFYGPGQNNDTGDKPAGIGFTGTGSVATTLLNKPNTASMIDKPGGDPSPPFDISKLGAKIAAARGESGDKKDDKKKDDKSGDEGSSVLDTSSSDSSSGDSGGGGAPGGDAGGGSATDDAGGTVGDTLGSLEDTGDIGDFGQFADATVATQAQDAGAILDGIASWDQLNNYLSGGTGYYNGGGTYSCSGIGPCTSSGGTGSFSYSMDICFLTKTYTGGTVSLSGYYNDSTGSLPSGSFPASGNAVFAVTGGTSGGSFTGTTATLMNSGGVQAASLDLNLYYTRSGDVATGSATTPYVKNPS